MKVLLAKPVVAEFFFVAVGIAANCIALNSLGNLPETAVHGETIKTVKQVMSPLRLFSLCGFIAILLFIVNICAGKRSHWAFRLLLIVLFLFLGVMIGDYLSVERAQP